MLIGVMCEVVSGVSQTEREVIAEAFVREKARPVWMGFGSAYGPRKTKNQPKKGEECAFEVVLKVYVTISWTLLDIAVRFLCQDVLSIPFSCIIPLGCSSCHGGSTHCTTTSWKK